MSRNHAPAGTPPSLWRSCWTSDSTRGAAGDPGRPNSRAFVLGEKRKGERETLEIYREARRGYARDRGETTLEELLSVLE